MRVVSAFLILGILIGPAAAQETVPPVEDAETFWWAGFQAAAGSLGYRSGTLWMKVSAKGEDLPGVFSAKPSLTSYRSDLSSGAIRSASVRFAYAAAPWDFGLTLGGTGVHDGYGNGVFGVDATHDFEGEYEPSLGGGLTHTGHHEEVHGSFVDGRGRTHTLNGTATLDQNDLSVWGSATARKATAYLTLTHSFYDRNPGDAAAFAERHASLGGVSALISGFPEASQTLKIFYDGFPKVSPFLALTHTSFVLDQPDSRSVILGVYVTVADPLEVNVSWERWTQSGVNARRYISAGLQYRL